MGPMALPFDLEDVVGVAVADVLRRCLADPGLVAGLRPVPPGTIADNYDLFLETYQGRSRPTAPQICVDPLG